MRWPRLSKRRSDDSKLSRRQSRPSSSSSSEEPQADKETETNPPLAPADYLDPSLTRLFSDATSYNQILNTCTDVAGDSRAAHDSPNGFSQLVACDLEDHELVASETLAQLSVSNWAPGESTDLAPDVGIDESEEGPSEGEHDMAEPSGITRPAVEPKFEDKLKPDEVLDLIQQDFGALAPPGEEKLLLETDATLFQEVVVLVCQFIWDNP
jgi:sterol 3beta-glucosyltransferase